jgi:transcriptional regulator with XRE-family HTH domain
MGRTALEQAIVDRQRAARARLGEELRRARLDAGLSIRAIAGAAHIDPSHLSRVERGIAAPSQDALVAIATAMGHRASIKLFPTDGPRVRDHLQLRMEEALIHDLHSRWVPRLEVAVYQPVRGVIDVVLQDRTTRDIVAGESHSLLTSVEHQLRWAGQKADSLPSAQGWPWADTLEPPRIGRLLLLRSSGPMHDLVRAAPLTFRAAYPADPAEAYAALTTGVVRWPGAAILWVTIDGTYSRLIAGQPRGLARL